MSPDYTSCECTLGCVVGSQCISAWTGHRRAQPQSQEEAYTARSRMPEEYLVEAAEDKQETKFHTTFKFIPKKYICTYVA